ncbi:hypothetical protein NDU88_006367 [Pleurodeles waltl]|uniref:Uncharacterized protein n=1 Tax=Pleurodeles waltl TaxID=8319 RepID=A0AAV7U056_PLEWA|nr:hypothetical protein NDU88_006367 [Pleurodeles waltl]
MDRAPTEDRVTLVSKPRPRPLAPPTALAPPRCHPSRTPTPGGGRAPRQEAGEAVRSRARREGTGDRARSLRGTLEQAAEPGQEGAGCT